MGKYFGREPRYSREEIEQQAQAAIDALVSQGRPPAEDWAPLQARLDEIDEAIVARGLSEQPPLPTPEVRLPPARPQTRRRPVGARPLAD
jgi:hypothetical protein